jgi:hypothetical protein
MKIRPVGAELFHEEGQTDRQRDKHDEANNRFSQFLRTCLKSFGIHFLISLALRSTMKYQCVCQEGLKNSLFITVGCVSSAPRLNGAISFLYSTI